MWTDKIVVALAKTPFHKLMGRLMLIRYIGKKSGKKFEVPVMYTKIDGLLYTSSDRRRTWWRNFHEATKVELILSRRKYRASSTSITDRDKLLPILVKLLQTAPQIARYYKVPMNDDGGIDPADLADAMDRMLVVVTEIIGEID